MRSKLSFDILLVLAVILLAVLMPAGIMLMHWIRSGDPLCATCDATVDYWHAKPIKATPQQPN